jgi:hypothetical protein
MMMMKDGYVRIWKKAVVVYLKIPEFTWIVLGISYEKPQFRLNGKPNEIRNIYLLNKSLRQMFPSADRKCHSGETDVSEVLTASINKTEWP